MATWHGEPYPGYFREQQEEYFKWQEEVQRQIRVAMTVPPHLLRPSSPPIPVSVNMKTGEMFVVEKPKMEEEQKSVLDQVREMIGEHMRDQTDRNMMSVLGWGGTQEEEKEETEPSIIPTIANGAEADQVLQYNDCDAGWTTPADTYTVQSDRDLTVKAQNVLIETPECKEPINLVDELRGLRYDIQHLRNELQELKNHIGCSNEAMEVEERIEDAYERAMNLLS